MGKMGDLIVRLRLQYDDYKKGLKKASADTTTFAGTLGKIKAAGVAVWAAIGAAVVGFAKQLIQKSNAIGDAWARTTAQMKGAWDTFVQSVASLNFDNLIGRMKEASRAAKELTNALDSEFETNNSIRLQRAAMEEELAALEIIARNQNKTYEERAAAAQKYLDMVKPLYDQQINLAKRLEDAHISKWLAGSGLNDTEQTRKDLRNFLVAYGKDQNLINSLGTMVDALSKDWKGSTKLATAQFNGDKTFVANYRAAAQFVADYEKNNGYGTSIYALARVYEKMRGDADTQPLVDAMIAAGEAAGAFDKETKRMRSALNSSMAKIGDSFSPYTGIAAAANEQLKFDSLTLDVDTEGLDFSGLDAEITAFADRWNDECLRIKDLNEMLEMSFVASLSGGMQAITDALMGIEGAGADQILAALLQPFGQSAIQLGEMLVAQGVAIDVFKKSLESLQGGAAIAAGLALIAVGSAISSGIKSLAGGAGGTSTATATAGASGSGVSTYEQEITINVVGEISGDKIVLAGQKTLNKWNR